VVGTAASPEALGRLERMLDGTLRFEKLPLDDDKRWRIIWTLAACGRPGVLRRAQDQLGRDPTSLGRLHALTAETLMPDLVRKEAAFRRCLDDTRSSLEELRALMGGFHHPQQETLARSFVGRYLEAIPRLHASREEEIARSFVGAMYPQYVHDSSVVAATKAFLAAHPDLPYDLRKPLLIDADEMERCLRIRRGSQRGRRP
jgi:aminopeptidase N